MTATEDDELRSSKYLGERYKNLKKIAEGGMGVVYLANDPMLDIEVAIKILRPETSSVPVIRFQQEARAVAKLHHQNVIRELDCGVLPDNNLYIVMEFLDGMGLDVLLEKHGRMTADRAVPIFKQIADGMAHAHGLGVLHRDLKPSNIIVVDPFGAVPLVKIVDFGLAVSLAEEQDESRTHLSGSPLYMAPEIIEGKPAGERADIYSLGCLMMECLTLSAPFSAKTVMETLLKHRTEQPPLLSERISADGIPVGLEETVDKCLSKDPDDRFQSMTSLRDDLQLIEKDLRQKLDAEKLNSEKPNTEQLLDVQSGAIPSANATPKVSNQIGSLIAGIVVAILCFGGLGYYIWPELSALIKPSEPAPVSVVLEGETEGDALIESTLKDKFGVIETYGGLWTFNKQAETDSDLAELSKRTDIERLSLNKTYMTGTGLKYLKGNKLVSIALIDTMVNGEGMQVLAEFPTISVIRLVRSKNLDDQALTWILKLPRLHTLYLCMNNKLTKKSLDTITKIPRLQRLSVQGITPIDSVSKISSIGNLTALSLENTGVKGATLNDLRRLKKLIALDLSGLQITDEQMHYVALPQIQMLVLRKNLFTVTGLKELSKCKDLRVLDLRQCPNIRDVDAETLKKLFPKVEIFQKGSVTDIDQHSIQEDVLRYVEQPSLRKS
jgi:serine/threonine protein kinase